MIYIYIFEIYIYLKSSSDLPIVLRDDKNGELKGIHRCLTYASHPACLLQILLLVTRNLKMVKQGNLGDTNKLI